MDGSSQVRHAEAVVVRIASWLRDEEAGGPARTANHSAIRLSASVHCTAEFGRI
jgi:hypothetical protein